MLVTRLRSQAKCTSLWQCNWCKNSQATSKSNAKKWINKYDPGHIQIESHHILTVYRWMDGMERNGVGDWQNDSIIIRCTNMCACASACMCGFVRYFHWYYHLESVRCRQKDRLTSAHFIYTKCALWNAANHCHRHHHHYFNRWSPCMCHKINDRNKREKAICAKGRCSYVFIICFCVCKWF